MPNSEEKASKREELYKQMESGAAHTDSTDDDKNRIQAAKQWVSHFNSVLDLIDSTDEPVETNEQLAAALVKSWKAKADEKDEHLKDRLKRLRA